MGYTVDSFFNSDEKLAVIVGSLENKEMLTSEFDKRGYTLDSGESWFYYSYNYPLGYNLVSLCFANNRKYGSKRWHIDNNYTILSIADFDFNEPPQPTVNTLSRDEVLSLFETICEKYPLHFEMKEELGYNLIDLGVQLNFKYTDGDIDTVASLNYNNFSDINYEFFNDNIYGIALYSTSWCPFDSESDVELTTSNAPKFRNFVDRFMIQYYNRGRRLNSDEIKQYIIELQEYSGKIGTIDGVFGDGFVTIKDDILFNMNGDINFLQWHRSDFTNVYRWCPFDGNSNIYLTDVNKDNFTELVKSFIENQ